MALLSVPTVLLPLVLVTPGKMHFTSFNIAERDAGTKPVSWRCGHTEDAAQSALALCRTSYARNNFWSGFAPDCPRFLRRHMRPAARARPSSRPLATARMAYVSNQDALLSELPDNLPPCRPPHSSSFRPSWWQRQYSSELTNHNAEGPLPDTADIIIIGSGITGSHVAAELVNKLHRGNSAESATQTSIVVLEAREFCSGATCMLSVDEGP